jgi:hypothetical protein
MNSLVAVAVAAAQGVLALAQIYNTICKSI